MARTTTGKNTLKDATNAGIITLHPYFVPALATIQTGQTGRRRALFARLAGLKLLGRVIPHYRGLHIMRLAPQNKLHVNLKNFLGMVRRGLTGRLGQTPGCTFTAWKCHIFTTNDPKYVTVIRSGD